MSNVVPAFSSFPDFDSDQEKRKKDKDRKRDKPRKEKDRHRERERDRLNEHPRRKHSRSRSPVRESSSKRRKHDSKRDARHELLDDEKAHSKRHRDKPMSGDEISEAPYLKSFFIDKRGDMRNLTMGGLHQGDVPKFHRAGKGAVLGLSSAWNIVRGSGNKQIEVRLRGRRKLPRYTDSKSRAQLLNGPRRFIAIPSGPTTASGEFIPIGKSRRTQNEDALDSYRSIEQKRSGDDNSDEANSQSALSSVSSMAAEEALSADQQSIKALEAALARTPNDIGSWLKLLDLSVKPLSQTAKRSSKAKAEVSISILERALDAHPENTHSVPLRLLYLERGQGVWSEQQLEDEWESALRFLGGPQTLPSKRAAMWLAWLEWRIVASRSVKTALGAFRRVFDAWRDHAFEIAKVKLCWRTVIYLREAGFLEQAFAVLQAQIELSCFCPKELVNHELQSKLDRLETFWDSEAPRFGEKEARGWLSWNELDDLGMELPKKQAPKKMDLDDPYQLWFCLESALDKVGKVPTRSFSEEEEDPFSTILFSDIRPFISEVHTAKAKSYLMLVLLAFLGLNIPGIDSVSIFDGTDNEAIVLSNGWMNSGVGGWVASPEQLFPDVERQRTITWESQVGTTIGLEKPRQPAFGPVKEWTYDRSPFEATALSGEGRAWEIEDLQNVHIETVKLAFEQLSGIATLPNWADLYRAINATLDIKSTIKTSRQQLEESPSSLPLWRRHAELERIRGKMVEAGKIYTMAADLDARSTEMPMLIADAVEFFWLRNDVPEAKRLLAQFLDVQGSLSGLNILRARKSLEGKTTECDLETPQWDSCIRLRLFLELSISNAGSAMSSMDEYLTPLILSTRAREYLEVWICLKLWQISQLQGAMIPPSMVTDRVSSAISVYHNNTILLGLFLECQRGQGIWGHVRTLLDDADAEEDTAGPFKSLKRTAWDIWAEDWGYGPWEPERVRMKLENAAHSRLRNSLVLWQIYLALEIHLNHFERAKAVLFRALGCCPWAKELYMTALGPLRAVFSARELNDLVSAMVERGIRMRRDLDEIIEGWRDPTIIQDEVGQGDEELEALVHGRELAKPY